MKFVIHTTAMVSFLLFGNCIFCFAGGTYYISPTGDDAYNGKTIFTPWKTFYKVFDGAGKLFPGDTLILMDGTYTMSANSGNNPWGGLLTIIFDPGNNGNGSTTRNGTASAHITIKAQNERKAFLQGDGVRPTLTLNNCSYYDIVGIHAEGVDNLMGQWSGQVIWALRCKNLTFKRLLLARPNRYENTHLLMLDHTDSSLVEESEFYYFHRHAMVNWWSNHNTFRRNYVNSRQYADIPGGFVSHTPDCGDGAVSTYPGSYITIENVISEGNEYVLGEAGFDTTGTGTWITKYNKLLGCISINDWVGVSSGPNRLWQSTYFNGLLTYTIAKSDLMPQDNLIKDLVILNPRDVGMNLSAVKRYDVQNVSVIENGQPRDNPRDGVGIYDFQSEQWGQTIGNNGDGQPSVSLSSILVINNNTTGVKITIADWTVDHSNAHGNNPNYVPTISDPRFTNSSTSDPKLGSCKVWVPDDSPMKGAGNNGLDIGANILYRYQNGVLTGVPLWDCFTGEFPHGAVVTGLNDITDSSCFDIHKRLNVNVNGCFFPARYCSPSSVLTVAEPFSTITIYPNPAIGKCTIVSSSVMVAFEIYNLVGELLYSSVIPDLQTSTEIDISNLQKGIYFARIRDGKHVLTGKIVIQ